MRGQSHTTPRGIGPSPSPFYSYGWATTRRPTTMATTRRTRRRSSRDSKPPDSAPASEPDSAPRRGALAFVWRWTKRLVVLGLLLGAAAASVLWWTLNSYEEDLPSTAELRDYQPPQVTRVLARDGSLLAELFVQRRTVVSIEQIPREMKMAVLAAEDADFYQHEGLDYLGMLRALYVNVRSQKARQGGSTITQQLVKNVLLSPERTFERKARELLLARRIEQELTKDQILELYLNHIYFGHGRYGVEEAARYYFGKKIGEVTLAEAAMLAALPKGPNIYSPRVDLERAKRRRNLVLAQLAAKNMAAPERIAAAKEEPIVLAPATEKLAHLAPETIGEVERTLRAMFGPAAQRGGFEVTTTIDPQMQAAARRAVRANLDAFAKRHGGVAPIKKAHNKGKKPFEGIPASKGHKVYNAVVVGTHDGRGELTLRVGKARGVVKVAGASRYNPRALPASKVAEVGAILRVSPIHERGQNKDGTPRQYRLELAPQSAMVVVDVKTREIRALVGSYEAIRGTLDRTRQMRRQPGSTFKPLVYSYGIHTRRLTPATPIPVLLGKPPPEGETAPPLLLRKALAGSVNAAAVWALKDVGPTSVVSWAQAFGIKSPMKPTESLALGSYELTPRELAGAYAVFASGGTYAKPILISRVMGPNGSEAELPPIPPLRRVMEPAEAYLTNHLLMSVVQYGTARRARKLGLPLAGKTGTTNKAKDAWFAGYSSELVCITWTGFDDAAPLGRGEQGATAALPAFISLMRAVYASRKPKPFARPSSGLVEVAIDPATGLRAYEDQEDAFTELFLSGSEPQDTAEAPDGAGGGGGAGGAGAGGAGAGGAGQDGGDGAPDEDPYADMPDAGAAAPGAGEEESPPQQQGSVDGGPPSPRPAASAAAPPSPDTPPTAESGDDPPPF